MNGFFVSTDNLCTHPKEMKRIEMNASSISLQFYLVMKGHGKQEENSMTSKSGPGKFVTSKVRVAHNSVSQVSNMPPLGKSKDEVFFHKKSVKIL